MKRNLILYAHAGSGNHGCEALVRSTAKCLKEEYDITLMTERIEEDYKYKASEKCKYIYSSKKYKKNTVEYFKYAIKYRLKKNQANPFPASCWQLKGKLNHSVAMSIGGDNYCYVDSNVDWLLEELITSHKYFVGRGVPTVLWGCSIEEDTLKNERLLKDIKKFDLITVRETLSKDNLEKYGLKDNVVLTCDSAFFLDTQKVLLPDKFIEGNTVGINVSPMVIENENKSGIVLRNYCSMIEYILEATDMNIALIPHVVWEGNDDRISLKTIYDKYAHTGRVVQIEDYNCEKLKGYIANCRFFIGARTHATIAAYSSGVPTLVAGYSIKAKGIAKDLFGTYEHFVVPVSEMTSENQLLEEFQWIYDNEAKIRSTLKKVLPEYKNRMKDSIKALERLYN